jgi:hypothetical protein
MSDPAEVFVPIVAILVIFGMPLAYLIIHRVFSHQERLEMIRQGVVPPQARRGAPYAVPPNFGADFEAVDYSTWQANRSLRKGITLTAVGAALFVGLSFIGHGEPGPWLLGGLIPLFIGIAQIIVALLSGARFSGMAPQMPPGQQQPGPQPYQAQQQPPPFAGGRDVPPGPYGWRPGPQTELEKPPAPPDTRY